MTANEIRASFLNFFESKSHHIVPSAPMVVKNDPTLMFTNAGMNQFKDIFLGNAPRQYPRVADSQKCLRVSGKHNDLEEVGHDTYHHTMFEMLGNWSFGDYFKKEAIEWAWEYLTEVLKLDKDRLYATVFEGDAKEGLERDNEAADYWSRFLPAHRVINGNKHDNFWEMGDMGPCGPCSEIHIDLRDEVERAKVPGEQLVNKDNPQVVEIWNLVFMQFNRKADGSLEPLPAKCVDTGMGFERLCMAIQGKQSNYDTDVFQPLIKKIGELSGCAYRQDAKKDVAMRVVADHIRTIAFSITDGQLPSNAKAGYVIRRILRRAVRYAYTFLGQKRPFLCQLLPTLIDSMGSAYPELKAQEQLVGKVIKEEEEAFLRTLETGIRLLDGVIAETKKKGQSEVSGKDAFTLFDTYGFPLDLTELILKEHGMTVNEAEFTVEMEAQKARARNAAAIETGDWVELKSGESHFVGYDKTETEVEILKYRQVTRKKEQLYQLVLEPTPFYGEMGGQCGDTGELVAADGERVTIIDTIKENGLSIHLTKQLPSNLNGTFTARVDKERREDIENNHTATHLLDYALREVLGKHVEQKGSLVTAESLRFDFSHFQKVTTEELRQAERLANAMVRSDIALEEEREMPIEEAKKMGAVALFGEKYGERVRVVKFGPSIEFCGGTHVGRTGKIGFIKITGETSVAAGVRRIEAVTGRKAEYYFEQQQDLLDQIRQMFNNAPNLVATIMKEVEENGTLKKQMEEYAQQRIKDIAHKLSEKAMDVNGLKIAKLVTIQNEEINDLTIEMARGISALLRGQFAEDKFMFVAGVLSKGKPMLLVMLSQPAVEAGHNAIDIVRESAKVMGGNGGGQPFLATAGGRDATKLDEAVEAAIDFVTK